MKDLQPRLTGWHDGYALSMQRFLKLIDETSRSMFEPLEVARLRTCLPLHSPH